MVISPQNKIRAACWWQADFDLYKMRNADEPGRVSLGSILDFAFRTCAKNQSKECGQHLFFMFIVVKQLVKQQV